MQVLGVSAGICNAGAYQELIKIIGDHTDKYVQHTSSMTPRRPAVHQPPALLVIAKIRSPYYVIKADFVAANAPAYIIKGLQDGPLPGGTFLVNCQWDAEGVCTLPPAEAKRHVAKNNINVYLINAIDLPLKQHG